MNILRRNHTRSRCVGLSSKSMAGLGFSGHFCSITSIRHIRTSDHRSEVPRYYMCSRKTDLGAFGSGRVDHKLWGCSGTK